MRTHEWIILAYYVLLAVASWLRPVGPRRRSIIALSAILAVSALALLAKFDVPTLRLWAPLFHIPLAYYVSGQLFVSTSPVIESWLQNWDRRLLGDSPVRSFADLPPVLLNLLDWCYLATPLVPVAGLAVLLLSGHSSLADRFWTMVVGTELIPFGMLAIVQTRPPWAFEDKCVDRGHGQRLAGSFVQHFTIRANTFPSGHVAASFAVALSVGGALPTLGLLFFLFAITIAIATVVGRYHYVMDAVTGVLLALVLWICVSASG